MIYRLKTIVPAALRRAIRQKILVPLIRHHPDAIQAAGKPGTLNPWWQKLEQTANRQIFIAPDQSSQQACREIYEAYRPILAEYHIDLEQFFLGSIKQKDAEALYQLVRQRQPFLTYQVGTFAGYSAMIIAHALRMNGKGTLIAVDPEIPHRTMINPVDIAKQAAEALGLTDYIRFVRGWHSLTSVDYISPKLKHTIPVMGREVLNNVEAKIDFVFIDGDHSTSCTVSDFWLIKDFLALQGITVFHDGYSWPTVAQAIYLILNDIYYYIRGTQAYFALDVWRGSDGLIALERVASEEFPTLKITVIDHDDAEPLSEALIRLPSLNIEAVTGKEGIVYIQQEITAGTRVEVSHKHYQSHRDALETGTDGDLAEMTIRIRKKPQTSRREGIL